MVHRSPWLAAIPRSRWRLRDLGQVIPWLRGRAPASIRRILRRLKVRYKRGRRYLHSPDLAYDAKLGAITARQVLARAAPDDVVLLYADELTYYARPSLARAWAPSGVDRPRVAHGLRANTARRIVACVNAVTGQLAIWQRSHFPHRTLARFFQEVAAAYPRAAHIAIALDNWPVHFHPELLAALPPRLELLRLPTYAPWTNPVEDLWHGLAADVLHHHPFADAWPTLQAAVTAWLAARQADPNDVLRRVGLWPH